jgi:hypothetical protein
METFVTRCSNKQINKKGDDVMTVQSKWLAAILILMCGSAYAQLPEAPKEMDVLKNDVGQWNCEIKMWMDPSGEPMVSKGTERNRMLGDMWLISEFKGDFGGMAFEGLGQYGYDTDKKKYVGSWVDSMSPYPSHMEGTWDAETKTMTHMGTGKSPDGTEMKSKSVVVYKDGGRVFTMYNQGPGGENDWQKVMEITYTKAK